MVTHTVNYLEMCGELWNCRRLVNAFFPSSSSCFILTISFVSGIWSNDISMSFFLIISESWMKKIMICEHEIQREQKDSILPLSNLNRISDRNDSHFLLLNLSSKWSNGISSYCSTAMTWTQSNDTNEHNTLFSLDSIADVLCTVIQYFLQLYLGQPFRVILLTAVKLGTQFTLSCLYGTSKKKSLIALIITIKSPVRCNSHWHITTSGNADLHGLLVPQ